MQKTYKFRIYPTRKQEAKLNYTLTVCRYLYNTALEQKKFAYRQYRKSVSYSQQANQLKELKTEYVIFDEVHSQILQDVLRKLDKSFRNFFRRITSGQKPGYPRFKGENRYNSFTYPQSGFEMSKDNLKLSKIGTIKARWHREIKGKIKTCSIKKDINRWYACFSVEYSDRINLPRTDKAIGIDLGIENFAYLSTGEAIPNPHFLKKSERRLKIRQRRLSGKVKSSGNRKKQRIVLAKTHRKIKEQRKDFCHKISRYLVNNYDLIAMENLNISGMLKNHYLAKSISEASWGLLGQYVSYKAAEADKRLLLVDPKYSSINCSQCGKKVPKTLAQRTHRCPYCNFVAHRDHNASIEILKRAITTVGITGSNAWLGKVCNPFPVNREAPSGRAG